MKYTIDQLKAFLRDAQNMHDKLLQRTDDSARYWRKHLLEKRHELQLDLAVAVRRAEVDKVL